MSTPRSRPNLFEYATSELSQDAFLCWFIDCANPKHRDVEPILQLKAREFIELLVADECTENLQIEDVHVEKQSDNIDVLAQVSCTNGTRYCIIIEDKTHTCEHSEQIQRYKKIVEAHERYAGDTIIPIYLKTGDMSRFERNDSTRIVNRKELINLMQSGCGPDIASDIYQDFLTRLVRWENIFQQFLTVQIEKWDSHQWCGFYSFLEDKLTRVGGWGYVSNPTGGFMCMHWCWRTLTDKYGPGVELYLQLEQQELCFKAILGDKELRKERKWPYHKAVLDTAQKFNIDKIQKRPRYVAAQYTSIAYWPGYIVTNENGIIETEPTLANLRVCESIMNDVADHMQVQ